MSVAAVPGDNVRVRAYGGGVLLRRVVRVLPAMGGRLKVYVITTDAELIKAHNEDREPNCVGFKEEYVIEVVP